MEAQGIQIARAFVSVEPDMTALKAGFAEADAQGKAFARNMAATTGQVAKTTASNAATTASSWTKAGKSIQSAGGTIAAAGKKTEKVGSTLNKTVGLPMLAIAAIAGKLSLDFGRSMQEIGTQAGASKKEVGYFKKELERLGAKGRYAQGPEELSEALFDIRSTGIKGAEALKALGAASDLATVGNADLESTTSGLVGVLRTGIKGAGNMQEAIGTLNATIGAGKMHMEDLNAAIGTGFLGSAQGLGLSLSGVGAALAELTSQGVPANSAATRLRMTMSLLANPTEKAAKELASIGIGSEDLAKKMRSSGSLIPALQDLEKHMKGLTEVQQGQLLAGAFGGSKSGGTIVQLLGQLGDLESKQHQVEGNTGKIGKSIAEANEDPAIKFQKVWSALQFDLVKLGNVIIPALEPVIMQVGEAIGVVAEDFSALSPETQHWIVKLGLAVIALGPVLSISGKILSTLGSVVSTAGKAAEAVGGLSATSTAGSAAAGGAGAAAGSADAKKLFLANSSGVVTGAVTVGKGGAAAGTEGTAAMEGLGEASAAAGPEVLLVVAAVAVLAGGLALLYKASKKFREEVGGLVDAAKEAFGEIITQVEPLIHSFEHFGHAVEHMKGPFGAIGEAIKAGFVPAVETAFHVAENVVKGFGKIFAGEIEVVRGVVELIADILEGRWGKMWTAVKTIFAGGLRSAVGVLQTAKTLLLAPVQILGKALLGAFGSIWGKVEGVFVGGINAVIGFIDTLLGVVEKIPGVGNLQIGKVNLSTGTGGAKNTGSVSAPKGHTSAAGYFSGGQITAPRAIVGEEAPAHNEWVIATNPSYRSANLGYWAQAGADLGVKGFAQGGRSAGSSSIAMFNPIGAAESIAGTAGEVIGAAATPITKPAELVAKGLGGVAGWGAEQFISALPTPDLGFPFQGLGGWIVDEVSAWIKSGFASGKLGEKSSPALSGGGVASPLAFAGYMLEAGFPHSQKVIAEGLGTIAAESGYKKNNGQGPQGHIGPWAESPTFGSVAVREDPRGSTFAAYRVGYAPTGSFEQAWGQWEASQSGTTGAMLSSEYMAIAAQALGGSRAHANKGSTTAPKGHGAPAGYAAGGKLAGPKGRPNAATAPIALARSTGGGGGGGGANPESVIGWAQHFLGSEDKWGYPGEWCGAFTGADMQAHGIAPPSGYPSASAWGGWGTSDSSPTRGDVVVIGGSGHVGIALGGNMMISGNYSGTVAESTIGDAASGRPITGYRTPPYTSGPTSKSKLGTSKEQVPGVFHGAHTHSLSFGSMPKTLHGVEKELGIRRGELHTYRRAADAAKNRPATQHALQANVTAIEGRIRELDHKRAQLRREAAERRFSHRLAGRLTAIGGFDNKIAVDERAYNEAAQYAEQLVDLEPTMPVNPDEGGELKYLLQLQSYVENKETPAYQKVLGSEATWRNTILEGETMAATMQTGFEGKVRSTDGEIDAINAYTQKVAGDLKDYREKHPKGALPDWLTKEVTKEGHLRSELPVLRFKDAEWRKAIGTAREAFYPGRKNPLEPPGVPVTGSGTFEEALVGVQGYHWPELHSKRNKLPSVPVAGLYGGSIWDTQSTIQELGLKVASALGGGVGEIQELGGNGEGGAGGGESVATPDSTAENQSIMAELARTMIGEQKQRDLINALQKPVIEGHLPPFAGSFALGGTVPGPAGAPRTIIAHGGEEFMGLGGGSSSAPVIYVIVEDAAIDSSKIKVVADEAFDVRMSKGGRGAGRRMPGGSGGNFGQGR